jgi:hypothetical protein
MQLFHFKTSYFDGSIGSSLKFFGRFPERVFKNVDVAKNKNIVINNIFFIFVPPNFKRIRKTEDALLHILSFLTFKLLEY